MMWLTRNTIKLSSAQLVVFASKRVQHAITDKTLPHVEFIATHS